MHSFALFSLALIHAVSGLTIKERQAEVSLDELVEAKGKEYFGTCADEGTLSNEKNAAIIPANFGQVTPENSMKWESLQCASKEMLSEIGSFALTAYVYSHSGELQLGSSGLSCMFGPLSCLDACMSID